MWCVLLCVVILLSLSQTVVVSLGPLRDVPPLASFELNWPQEVHTCQEEKQPTVDDVHNKGTQCVSSQFRFDPVKGEESYQAKLEETCIVDSEVAFCLIKPKLNHSPDRCVTQMADELIWWDAFFFILPVNHSVVASPLNSDASAANFVVGITSRTAILIKPANLMGKAIGRGPEVSQNN